MSQNLEDTINLNVEYFVHKKVKNFKYLVDDINNGKNLHSKVRRKINVVN